MPSVTLPFSTLFHPRLHRGVVEFPVHHMRGGTSTGLVLWEAFAPKERVLREELLRLLMGVPREGQNDNNRQITGLGRGSPTSNKVFFAGLDDSRDANRDGGTGTPVLVSTLAQLAHNHGGVDWAVNCGNMSASLQLWALDTGLIAGPATDQVTGQVTGLGNGLDTGQVTGPLAGTTTGRINDQLTDPTSSPTSGPTTGPAASSADGYCELAIRNTNTGVTTVSRMRTLAGGAFETTAIPGVDGDYPAVDLFMQNPAGAKTGRLLPTGAVVDMIDGIRVSCVDVAVPMVICAASDFGKTAHESVAALTADAAFMARLRTIWTAAGLKMGLKKRDGNLMTAAELAHSETIPKIYIVGPARHGGHIAARYFTPQQGHASMAVSGGCCLAAAVLMPGSVAQSVAPGVHVGATFGDVRISIEHPAGLLDATIVCRMVDGTLDIRSAAYRRSTQILLRGHVPLYGASDALTAALLG
ncbi:MAG: PrpF protein [Pseudomonadota bacterium]|nr:PrpF protein [Pseudomonadota bacterium]